MRNQTVCGPLKSKADAIATVEQMGRSNHSWYSMKDETEFYVERHLDLMPERILGYTWSELQDKQMKRVGP